MSVTRNEVASNAFPTTYEIKIGLEKEMSRLMRGSRGEAKEN